MQFDASILKNDERAIFALRGLYRANGYKPFKMSKFEEYDLYAKHKEFLVSDGVITFTDTSGKLLALKPDVTLSILGHTKGQAGVVERYYYNENVYRISESSHTYKEIMQTGLECIGDLTAEDERQVVTLAAESLALIDPTFVLSLSHVGLVRALLTACDVADVTWTIERIAEKNLGALKEQCTAEQFAVCRVLAATYSTAAEAITALREIATDSESMAALAELAAVCDHL
jgi:ATP phosphoribosyltransferase regulatory subunit